MLADPYPRNKAVDVLKYTFRLEFNDTTDQIAGEATVVIRFTKPTNEFELDLVGKGSDKTGMTVQEVRMGNQGIKFSHQKDRLKVHLQTLTGVGETLTISIRYSGIAADGIIIGKNKFGDRTFFGDNWPDRGHHWLPCIDHPSDKAKVDFIVVAPDQYQVVASGKKKEETNLPRHQKLTRWEEGVEIAVKVMTIGIARFAVEQTGEVDNIPQSTWVYPQNRTEGFNDFAVGTTIFEFFHKTIGPYPYEKLAHVQSKTRWGGAENAGNIFYSESSVTGKNDHVGLIAHEIAHQWFGNSATENDWHHVWLSEGFATYFAALYTENAQGKEKFVEEMKEARQSVISYYKKTKNPVIDTTIMDINKVLNTNSYQKGSWVLHMLRKEVGDPAFWRGIQNFYAAYRNKNAMTNDFRREMEKVSGKDLTSFFNQWLFVDGHPQLSTSLTFDHRNGKVKLTIRQNQAHLFRFPLEILLKFPEGKTELVTVQVAGETTQVAVDAKARPLEMMLDPGGWLLFEAEVKGK